MPASAPSAETLPIQVERVSKRFEGTLALQDISVDVPAGTVLGLLGPNGAGKTTLIRTILDIIRPDEGRIAIFGRQLTPEIRDAIGYLPEERGLYPRQPVLKVLEYLGCLKGMTPSDARTQAAYWLERFGIGDAGPQRVEQLSKGNQQKVQIAATLLSRPRIIVLDEPLSGLDPVGARVVHTVIRELAAECRTVVLSTHQMNTVESLCTRVFMLAHGRQVLDGELRDIKARFSTRAIRVRSSADYRACPFVESVSPEPSADQSVEVHLRAPASAEQFLGWLLTQGACVESFERLSTPLEDIFVRVAEKEAAARAS
jgi:ABC-2 type transport system ATP-binding protein